MTSGPIVPSCTGNVTDSPVELSVKITVLSVPLLAAILALIVLFVLLDRQMRHICQSAAGEPSYIPICPILQVSSILRRVSVGPKATITSTIEGDCLVPVRAARNGKPTSFIFNSLVANHSFKNA